MNVTNNSFRAFFITAVLLAAALSLNARENQVVALAADDLRDGKTVKFGKTAWKYRAGDDSVWAGKDFDDAGWKTITNEQIDDDPVSALTDWNGRAWFRLRVAVDESLANQPLALRVWHWGASEIYIDGELVQTYGAIHQNGDTEFNPRGLFFPVVFKSDGTHTIAVRYSFQAMSDLTGGSGGWLRRGNFTPQISLQIEAAREAALQLENRFERFDYFIVGLFFALALVHFLLFVFYPQESGNLYCSLFIAGIGMTALLVQTLDDSHGSAFQLALTLLAQQTTQAFGLMSLLAFLYVELGGGRVSRFFWLLAALWLVCLLSMFARVPLPFNVYLFILILTLADSVRLVISALVRKKPGAWIIGTGIGVLVVGVTNNVLFEYEKHFLPDWLHPSNLKMTILCVPIAVSIYLASNFARINKNLAAQLVRAVEHEKERARLEIVEAENERRAKELEEARQLQLSMLPKKLPQINDLEIAAYMKPASEVGGDYYDFHVSSDGTLTVAVGDATGHGLKAGTLVSATKSLFIAFADDENIPQIFKRTSSALKKMNLRGLFMAMTMVKIKNGSLTICAAGMPSALIYRRASGRVEEVVIRAMPLGSVANFAYEQRALSLSAGDCLVLMSDGFPEMFNDRGEMQADDQAKNLLAAIAAAAPQEIIDRFVQNGEQWANGRPQDDDVTFVVLKMKQANQ